MVIGVSVDSDSGSDWSCYPVTEWLVGWLVDSWVVCSSLLGYSIRAVKPLGSNKN